ncbi:MAG: PepSY-like domain-containing protein [Bacteroidaceae bacterium]|nr:PepSY-like domain-containing protein [Bacteroidaceae bacterium]
MKKLFFITLAILSLSFTTAKADNDRVISKEKLPANTLQFISTHFAGLKISYVKEERDLFEKNYQVVFTDGTKLEFQRNGEWKEIDCRYSQVPAAIIPEAIKKYVSEHYPNEKFLQIDHDRNDYEVKLSNRLELTFDKKFNIIDIDD